MSLFGEIGKRNEAIIKVMQDNLCVVGRGGYVLKHKTTKAIEGVSWILCIYSGLAIEVAIPPCSLGFSIGHDIIVGRNLSNEQDEYLKGIVNILNYQYKQVEFFYGVSNSPEDEWLRIDMNAYDDGTRYIHLKIFPESDEITEDNVMRELHRAGKIFMDVTSDFYRLLYTSIPK